MLRTLYDCYDLRVVVPSLLVWYICCAFSDVVEPSQLVLNTILLVLYLSCICCFCFVVIFILLLLLYLSCWSCIIVVVLCFVVVIPSLLVQYICCCVLLFLLYLLCWSCIFVVVFCCWCCAYPVGPVYLLLCCVVGFFCTYPVGPVHLAFVCPGENPLRPHCAQSCNTNEYNVNTDRGYMKHIAVIQWTNKSHVLS